MDNETQSDNCPSCGYPNKTGEHAPGCERSAAARPEGGPEEAAEAPPEGQESARESKYNFPEMELAKPAMIKLVKKLKEHIDSGDYQTLLSDEVGGRIPTLILDKILREKSPNRRELATFFLAFGRSAVALKELQQLLDKRDPGKILFITEYVEGAGTLKKFSRLFEDFNFDIAVVTKHRVSKSNMVLVRDGKFTKAEGMSQEDYLRAWFAFENKYNQRKKKNGKSTKLSNKHKTAGTKPDIFIGDYGNSKVSDAAWGKELFHKFSGVKRLRRPPFFGEESDGNYIDSSSDSRTANTRLFPVTEAEHTRTGDETSGYRDRDELHNYDQDYLWRKTWNKTLPAEKLAEIQDRINKGRQDVDRMAKEIMAKIWGTEQDKPEAVQETSRDSQ